MAHKRLKSVIGTRGLAWLWLVVISPIAIWAGSISIEHSVIRLSEEALSRVTGGALGVCCVQAQGLCGGITTGCQNVNNKCTGANSCPLANQQIKQNLQNRYPLATCASAAGALGTVNQAQIVCYNTVTCPQTCTQKAFYWYCDAGTNPQAGPNVTPTKPDNTTCPKP